MNVLLIVHVLASLFTLLFAVCTFYYVFHRYSLQHRTYKITSRIKPLILGKNSKKHIVDLMTMDGYPQKEVEEIYDIILADIQSRKNQMR